MSRTGWCTGWGLMRDDTRFFSLENNNSFCVRFCLWLSETLNYVKSESILAE